MMIIASILFSLLASSIDAQAVCGFTVNGTHYDLSPLKGKVLTWSGQDNPAYGFAKFRAVVCGEVTGCSSNSAYTSGSVCQEDDADHTTYNCGRAQGAEWIPATKPLESHSCLALHYFHGESSACSRERDSYMYFVCDENEEGVLDRVVEEFNTRCSYYLYIRTKYACPCGSKPVPSPSPSPLPPPVYTKPYIRVGHAIPSADVVDFVITQGNTTFAWNGVKYTQFSDWNRLFENGNGTVYVFQNNNGARGALLAKRVIFLTPGPLVVAIKGTWPPDELAIYPIAASYAPVPAGLSSVRLANLVSNTERIDLYFQSKAVRRHVHYPDASEFSEITATTGLFAVTQDTTTTPFLSFTATAPDHEAWSIFVLGLLGSSTYPPVAVRLSDAPLV